MSVTTAAKSLLLTEFLEAFVVTMRNFDAFRGLELLTMAFKPD